MPGSQRKREVRKEGPDSARASPLDFWHFGNKADFLCLYLLHLIERVKDTGDFVRQESNKSQGLFSSAFKGERRKGPNMEWTSLLSVNLLHFHQWPSGIQCSMAFLSNDWQLPTVSLALPLGRLCP